MRGRKSGNGPLMTHTERQATWHVLHFLNSTEETDRKWLDWNHCVNWKEFHCPSNIEIKWSYIKSALKRYFFPFLLRYAAVDMMQTVDLQWKKILYYYYDQTFYWENIFRMENCISLVGMANIGTRVFHNCLHIIWMSRGDLTFQKVFSKIVFSGEVCGKTQQVYCAEQIYLKCIVGSAANYGVFSHL